MTFSTLLSPFPSEPLLVEYIIAIAIALPLLVIAHDKLALIFNRKLRTMASGITVTVNRRRWIVSRRQTVNGIDQEIVASPAALSLTVRSDDRITVETILECNNRNEAVTVGSDRGDQVEAAGEVHRVVRLVDVGEFCTLVGGSINVGGVLRHVTRHPSAAHQLRQRDDGLLRNGRVRLPQVHQSGKDHSEDVVDSSVDQHDYTPHHVVGQFAKIHGEKEEQHTGTKQDGKIVEQSQTKRLKATHLLCLRYVTGTVRRRSGGQPGIVQRAMQDAEPNGTGECVLQVFGDGNADPGRKLMKGQPA